MSVSPTLVPALVFCALAVLAMVGAAATLLATDVLRMALGLGVFLLAVAGYFAYYGFGFLALAEVFVYVGGVLVLLLFAIMLVRRETGGEPRLTTKHDPVAAVACAFIGVLVVLMLRPVISGGAAPKAAASTAGGLASVFLGEMLPTFELVGLLLLVALVAVVVVMGGERR